MDVVERDGSGDQCTEQALVDLTVDTSPPPHSILCSQNLLQRSCKRELMRPHVQRAKHGAW